MSMRDTIRAAMVKSAIVPSAPDDRDYMYTPVSVTMPSLISLRQYAGDIKNQLNVGSCTCNATANACEIFTDRATQGDVDLSRQFLYDMAAIAENTQNSPGRYLRDVLKIAKNTGVPLESDWAYRNTEWLEVPTDYVVALAGGRKIMRFERIPCPLTKEWSDVLNIMAQIKSALYEGCPVVVGFYVNAGIFDITGPLAQQVYNACSPSNPIIGAHAEVIEEWSDAYDGFAMENSWGAGFGDNGFMRARWPIINDCFEAWVVRGFANIYISPQCFTDQQIKDYLDFVIASNGGNIEAAGLTIWNAIIQYGVETERVERIMGWLQGDVEAFAKAHNYPGA
jgi:C1A family cysteine protease